MFIKWFAAFEHIIDSCSQSLCNNRQGFAFAVFADQAVVIFFGLFIAPKVQEGGLGECPL